ncbi:bifunctional serine/threonine-protein kinase/ABC transporter substrate-binding protein [Streptomyces sp. NBC_00210]
MFSTTASTTSCRSARSSRAGRGTADRAAATAFVPGPSLSEVLEAQGRLSAATVSVLGLRLAEALEAVHRAGLVHRDVKPGNVLLAPDGPRLIDFGIARTPEGTALTSSGVIVGSPGFLSPEQAQARAGEIGPPSDVFSLGCLLAFAATGVRPFGGGAAAGMLLRTVHEEADLPGLPDALEPLVRACLDKHPARRPTAAQVREALDEIAPDDRERWLPEPVTRLIADRSAAVLGMVAIEPTRVPTPAGTVSPAAATVTSLVDPESRAPVVGRRGFLRIGFTSGAVAAGGGAWWWSTRGGRKTGGGASASSASSASRPELVVAFQGDLSGAARDYGRAQLNGARLAVERVNAERSRPLRLKLRPYDDGGEPERARDLAQRLTADEGVLGVLGPTTDACFLAVEEIYSKAVMPVLSVSVGVAPQVRQDSASTLRSHAALRPTDQLLAAPCIAYLTRSVDARKVFLVDDQAEGDFAWALCDQLQRVLRQERREATVTSVTAGTLDSAALAGKVMADRADAVVFSGSQERAAAFASALRKARFTGARVATQRAFGTRFLKSAGAAAEDWVFATTFIDPTSTPTARSFTAAYRARFDERPGWYAAEAYDAVLFLAAVCTRNGSPLAERGAIVRRMHEVDYRGISRTIEYTTGKDYNSDAMFLFRTVDGEFDFLGQYEEAVS